MKPWELDPQRYESLWTEKYQCVETSFAPFDAPAAEYFASPATAYRVRAEFRLWHDGDDLNYVMFDPDRPKEPIAVTDFPQALQPIQEAMPRLIDALRSNPVLRRKLFQAEFMASRSDTLIITLAYHRPLDEQWELQASNLARTLNASIIGRSRKQKRIVGRDWVEESFAIERRNFRYRSYDQSFVQPNVYANESMLNWVHRQAADAHEDLLELYCGNGNFTLPLATRYERVLATEVAKSGTRAAQENLRRNKVENVDLIRLSAEEVVQALNGVREFQRLKNLSQPLNNFEFSAVFVDPPRAGLDEETCQLIQRFDRIYYVSCNPETLRANLERLTITHAVKALAFFDQFPYTKHIESAVVLERR
ncbi:MAG: tRNA (uridine(54)-C5)-methyltransferase TrmA [Pseudomonadota bacterium]